MEMVKIERAELYDGTNSAFIMDWISTDPMGVWSIVSETETSLNLQYTRPEFSPDYMQVAPNSYFFKSPDGRVSNAPTVEAAEAEGWRILPAAPVSPKIQSGAALVPSLLLNTLSGWITVTFPEPFEDDQFSATPRTLAGANLVSALVVEEFEVVDEQSVRAKVRNTGLVSLGGYLLVHAVR